MASAAPAECDLSLVNAPTLCAVYALKDPPAHAVVAAAGEAAARRLNDRAAGASVDEDGRGLIVWLTFLPVDWKALDAAVAGAAPGAARRAVRLHLCVAEDPVNVPPRQFQRTIGRIAGPGSSVRFLPGAMELTFSAANPPDGNTLAQIRFQSMRPLASCRRRRPQPTIH